VCLDRVTELACFGVSAPITVKYNPTFIYFVHTKSCIKSLTMLSDVKLPPQCKWDLPYFGIELSVEWYFRIDVSGQPIANVFNGQAVHKLGTVGHSKMGPIGCP